MTEDQPQNYQSLHYYLSLPTDVGTLLAVRDELENMIWEIAREEGLHEVLSYSDLSIHVAEPAPDFGIFIEIVMSYLALKTIDKVTDRVLDKTLEETEELLKNKIVPKLREKLQELFGKNAQLIKAGNTKKSIETSKEPNLVIDINVQETEQDQI